MATTYEVRVKRGTTSVPATLENIKMIVRDLPVRVTGAGDFVFDKVTQIVRTVFGHYISLFNNARFQSVDQLPSRDVIDVYFNLARIRNFIDDIDIVPIPSVPAGRPQPALIPPLSERKPASILTYPYLLYISINNETEQLRYTSDIARSDLSKLSKPNADKWEPLLPYISKIAELAKETRGAEFKEDSTNGYVAMVPWKTGTYPEPLLIITPSGSEMLQVKGRFLAVPSIQYPSPDLLFHKTEVDDMGSTHLGNKDLQCSEETLYGGGYCTTWTLWFALYLGNIPSDKFWGLTNTFDFYITKLDTYRAMYNKAFSITALDAYNSVHSMVDKEHRSPKLFEIEKGKFVVGHLESDGKIKEVSDEQRPYKNVAKEDRFMQRFKKNVLADLSVKNGFRIAISHFTEGKSFDAFDIYAKNGIRTSSTYEFANLVNDTTTNTPILLFTFIGADGLPNKPTHSVLSIYYPHDRKFDIISTYKISIPDQNAISKVPYGYLEPPPRVTGSSKTYRRNMRKTRRRRTLRKH